MTSADLMPLLVETTLSMSAAIGIVLLVRRPLRRWFGAGIGYSAWVLVPVSILAVHLPAKALTVLPAGAMGDAFVVQVTASTEVMATDAGSWIVAAWMAGMLAMALRLAFQQRAFLRSLGELRPREDGAFQAGSIAGLPAVVGLLRPRTVLPADFDLRYTDEQRTLLRMHELEHVARGDLWANALVAALRCVSWFNPLVHLAARWFRHDQELACDQRVLSHRPRSRRAYGEAMFNTQLAAQPLPIGCHWGFGHPLKERIAMLKQPLPSRRRLVAGTALVVVLASFAGVTAWAAQPSVAAEPTGTPVPANAALESRMLHPPKYPAEALAQKVSGRVVLLIDVDATGTPTAIVVEEADPAGVFDTAAVAAAWNWKFDPEIKDGEPVASRIRVPVDFRLDPPGAAAPGAMASAQG